MISIINEGIRHQNSCQRDEQKWGVSFLGHLVCLSLALSPICYCQDSKLLVGFMLKVAGSPLAWIPEWLHGPELPHHYWLDFSWQGNKFLLVIKPQVWSKGPCPLCYIFLFLANRGGISLNCGQGAVVGKRMSLLILEKQSLARSHSEGTPSTLQPRDETSPGIHLLPHLIHQWGICSQGAHRWQRTQILSPVLKDLELFLRRPIGSNDYMGDTFSPFFLNHMSCNFVSK